MKLGEGRLGPAEYSIYGFSGAAVWVSGKIDLPVTFGTYPLQKTIMTTFMVVDIPFTYSGIIGCPTLRDLGAVVSTPHLKMKFPTRTGIGEVRGQQMMARQCYAASLKGSNAPAENFMIGSEDPRERARTVRGEPIEELDSIPISEDQPEKEVRIGSLLKGTLRDQMISFLRANKDVFAWSALDMPGIPPEMTVHRVNVNPTLKPVRQKKRNFAAERQTHIKAKVKKLLQAGFVKEIRYPEWLSNAVMVKKANGGWWACIDFTDLNCACTKDPYPLPCIDQLIDATSRHELLTFLDAFSSYNQIKMHEPDIPKTAFITDQGVYCYIVMSFGLKNARATYQRLVNKLFRKQIGRNVKVYVDDMLVKSLEAREHISDLQETFDTLRGPG
ncbi:uncharacterized protein LOC143888847 [Tasmannia lanceolata]|uniref:uncharacterized protein LOC143888847 n=1 Tax=Tasmannia lanceolata TaxID=3420 RepID=UPI0040638DD9